MGVYCHRRLVGVRAFFFNMKSSAYLSAIALAALVHSAQGQVFFASAASSGGSWYDSPPDQIHTQGVRFDVTGGGIEINALGAYDYLGDGIQGSLTVSLWDFDGQLATATVGAVSILNGNFAYTAITPIVLGPGTYFVGVTGYTEVDRFGEVNADGAVTYDTGNNVERAWDIRGLGSDLNLLILGGNVDNSFKVASFAFTPVPEPETYAMVAGLGLVGFGLWRRLQAK
jgi:hypothetical protein